MPKIVHGLASCAPCLASLAAGVALMIAAPTDVTADTFPVARTPIAFADLSGWAEDDHGEALQAFVRSCTRMRAHPPATRASGVNGQRLAALCDHVPARPDQARQFFEQHFTPYRVESEGLLTGYFEPEVRASLTRTGAYQHPIYALPPGLAQLPGPPERYGISEAVTWGLANGTGFEAFPDRAAIMAGALDGQGLELAYLTDPVDVFFIHIQGSARLAMTDGSVQRINFAGKSGHAYTPIGRTLVERGDMALADVTMDSLRAWLGQASDDERDIVLATNRSYIFFTMSPDQAPENGPIAAAGVPLTPERSLAVDRHLHTFGTPIFIQSPDRLPGQSDYLSRLMIAQDTGSAIVGPARGDIFIGSGLQAGHLAGQINQPVAFTILRPNPL